MLIIVSCRVVKLKLLIFPPRPWQIVASGSTVYAIPWPPQFMSFISTLRLFLIDVISITKANCAQPMNYYGSMMLLLVGFKVVLILLLLGPWLWGKLQNVDWVATSCLQRRQASQVRRKLSAIEDNMVGRRRASLVKELQRVMPTVVNDTKSIDWVKVLKASFMLLFVAYPGTLSVLELLVWCCSRHAPFTYL